MVGAETRSKEGGKEDIGVFLEVIVERGRKLVVYLSLEVGYSAVERKGLYNHMY